MDSVEVVNDKKKEKSTDPILAGKSRFFLLLVPYAVIDLIFAVRLSALMASHAAASDYVVSALAFEACFLTSLIPLWMCLVPVKMEDQEIRARKNLPTQVCFLVLMLLLTLMQFSSLTQAYDRLKIQ
jgi:high-affinity K+ transport system ATPase subunit B